MHVRAGNLLTAEKKKKDKEGRRKEKLSDISIMKVFSTPEACWKILPSFGGLLFWKYSLL